MQTSFTESEEEDAEIGGNIHESVFGELLEHALADAVVRGRDAEGEGVAGAFGALDFSAVHGDHLAQFGEILYYGLLEGANAVLGDDLADHQAGGRHDRGGLAETRAKARRRHQRPLF